MDLIDVLGSYPFQKFICVRLDLVITRNWVAQLRTSGTTKEREQNSPQKVHNIDADRQPECPATPVRSQHTELDMTEGRFGNALDDIVPCWGRLGQTANREFDGARAATQDLDCVLDMPPTRPFALAARKGRSQVFRCSFYYS